MEAGFTLFWSTVALLASVYEGSETIPSLSVSRTIVFGPGIHQDTNSLPINYFFIQARDSHGYNLTDTPRDAFAVQLSSSSRERIRRLLDVHYLGGGLYLAKYKTVGNYLDVSLSITHDGVHVSSSPYSLGALFEDNCYCPLKSVEEWSQDFHCPDTEAQIQEDLHPFRKEGVNLTGMYEKTKEVYPSHSIVYYSIIGGKLYAKAMGSIVGFKHLSDMILLSLINKVQLPDMELVVNLGDWPLSKKGPRGGVFFPTFSWCGSGDTWDIIWPTWDLMKSIILGMDRVSLSILTAHEPQVIPWSERDPRVYFRGRDSNKARLELVKRHRQDTQLFDVGIVAWFFFKHEEDVYGPVAKRVGFNEFFKFRYQINIDGTVAAYRFPFLMAGGSLIFKQASGYYEHFYKLLVPWQHYIPIDADLDDLVEQVEWARARDEEAEEIAKNAVQFSRDHLLPEHLYCYMIRLLQDYATLQVGTRPQIHPGMELVVPEKPSDCSGVCQQVQRKRKKEESHTNDDDKHDEL